jgi:hypothetical protein
MIKQFKDKTITSIVIDNNKLTLSFNDNTSLIFRDDGQDCCEYRYMHTDDDLNYFNNSKLLNAKILEGPTIDSGDDDIKECEFLIITTSKGDFTIQNYNKNNGYYGGFNITVHDGNENEIYNKYY